MWLFLETKSLFWTNIFVQTKKNYTQQCELCFFSPYDSRTPMTSWESKASPSLSAWTSFMALSCSLFLMLEKMDSFHVSSISCRETHKAVYLITWWHCTCTIKTTQTVAPPHLADDAVLHIWFLVAALFSHQSDLQLAERLGQDVTLCEELPPLHNVGFQQRCVILVTQHPLRKREKRRAGLVNEYF